MLSYFIIYLTNSLCQHPSCNTAYNTKSNPPGQSTAQNVATTAKATLKEQTDLSISNSVSAISEALDNAKIFSVGVGFGAVALLTQERKKESSEAELLAAQQEADEAELMLKQAEKEAAKWEADEAELMFEQAEEEAAKWEAEVAQLEATTEPGSRTGRGPQSYLDRL